jgi:predicted 2-oxoglutarate/Fe(II)-dependent dioxygenase YbiX
LIEARKRAAELVIDPIWVPLKESVHEYSSRFGINVPRTITRNIDIRVYATGQELAPHTDTNTGGPFTHYSLVIYLNDDYEGGEIHFIDSGVKIKPSAGTIVAFPATTLHESIPVSSGEKWHSPCFWYDEVSLVTSGKEPPSIDRFKND